MNLERIVFGGVVFPLCRTLSIEHGREVKETKMPKGASVLEELGKNAQVISGTAEFTGEKKYRKYIDLYEEFEKGGYRTLIVPGFLPVQAYFSKLNMVAGKSGKSVEFEFKFVCKESEKAKDEYGYYQIKEGDNLWNVANEFDLKIDDIMKMNNFFVDPFDVSVGELVRVK